MSLAASFHSTFSAAKVARILFVAAACIFAACESAEETIFDALLAFSRS